MKANIIVETTHAEASRRPCLSEKDCGLAYEKHYSPCLGMKRQFVGLKNERQQPTKVKLAILRGT